MVSLVGVVVGVGDGVGNAVMDDVGKVGVAVGVRVDSVPGQTTPVPCRLRILTSQA